MKIKRLFKECTPKKKVQDDCITLIWGDVKFFGVLLSAKSTFYPEETLVKDRHLNEIILDGEIESKKHIDVVKGISEVIGDPTGHLELANLRSHNWLHDDIEVSSNFISNTSFLKIVIRK